MPLETASHITDLVSTNPASGDQLAVADDHLRLIKSVLLTDFATINGPITATVAEINSLNGILKTQLDRSGSLTTTNTATAYNLATNTVFASLSAMNGKAIIFKPHVTSGASPTLNVDGLGAVALKSIAGTVIPTGALLIGGRYAVTYNDSATEFVVHGIFGVLPSTQFSGAVTVQAGGLTVTAGASTFGAAVTISAGGAAITGNSSVTGTLGVSSDFAINTNKFNVTASNGNTTVAGTLGVTGLVTASAGLTVSSGAVSLPAASVADAALATPPTPHYRVLLATLTASNSAVLSDTTNLTSTYESYELVFSELLPATTNTQLELQVHSGGAFQTTTYLGTSLGFDNAGAAAVTSTTFIPLSKSAAVPNNSGGVSGFVRVNRPDTANVHLWYGQLGFQQTTNDSGVIVQGSWNSGAAVTGFRVLFSSGNITSGTIKIYGLK